MLTLAQTDEAIKAGSEVIKTAGSLGSDVFLTSIILIAMSVLGGIYVWYVAIPNGKSHRENSEKLSTVMQTMGTQTTSTLDHAVVIRGSTDVIQKQIDRLIGCKKLEVEAIQKISDACKVDVSNELFEIKGRLS